MTYAELCMALLTYGDSPFKMNVWTNFSVSGAIFDFFNLVAYGIGYLFKIVLDGMNDFAISAYKFMSFSESDTIRGLYDVLSKYIWIPVLLCGAIMCFRILMGDIMKKNVGKQFIRNICYLFIAVAILPSIFSYLNKGIFNEKFYTDVSGADPTDSISDDILRTNATDRLWLYDYMVTHDGSALSDLDEKISTMKGELSNTDAFIIAWDYYVGGNSNTAKDAVKALYGELTDSSNVSTDDFKNIIKNINKPTVHKEWKNNAAISNHLTFDNWSTPGEKITEHVKNDWSNSSNNSSGEYIEGVPNLFKIKAVPHTNTGNGSTKTTYGLEKLSDGTDLLGLTKGVFLGKESYWRYDIDWFNVYIELIAHAYVFFVVGFCAVKLIMELIVHQVFGGMMAAMDLSGGDRIKKYFTAIIGCYMGLLIGAMVIPLYHAGCDFITNDLGIESGFIRALLEIVLAMVIVNVPNIIAMYFGVNTGSGAGAAMFGAGAILAWKATKATGKAVGKTTRGVARMGMGFHVRDNEMLQNARFEAGRAEQRAQAQHSQEREQIQDQRYAEQQTRNTEQAQRSQEREQIQDQRNEKQDLTDNAGLSTVADEAHNRNTSFDLASENQRKDAFSNIASEAEKNGGTRQAYMDAAEKELKSNGALKPTQETIAYSADAAKMQHEQANINTRAADIAQRDNSNITPSVQGQAAREVLGEWGALDRNISAATAHNVKAESLPKENHNPNLNP